MFDNKLKSRVILSRRKILALGGFSLAALLIPPPLGSGQSQPAQFELPFSGAPSLASWYLRQWYGNTRWAFRQKRALYAGGQGFHFGVDFFAPCGSAVLAIGSGSVLAVDGPYGAGPHNVAIRHANGYASLYGHLQERSTLKAGESIKQGQLVGHSGAPTPAGGDCDTHPHLHLEIRSADMSRAFNPVTLIPTDWYNLTLGLPGEGLDFEINLDNPRQWQNIYDQPNIRFGGALLNDYARSYPGQI